MKTKHAFLVTSLMVAVSLTTGCTTKHWYNAFQSNMETTCRLRPADAEQCLSRINRMSYPDYEKARTGTK
ncbi:hypothetical protein [Uliginosibacterium sp. H1]|uniref:hypothetical protein n=1 Tax=Uliginosibacterium sp. H1 TaxID=3114757 RepID=UPI002E17DEE4|nr:hypothetical protein [Uliginosibacterium sp. H1]